MSNIQFTMNK